MSGEYVQLSCIHGDRKPYPLAEVLLEVEGDPQLCKVGVVPELSDKILLGRDLPHFEEYLAHMMTSLEPGGWLEEALFRDCTIECPPPVKGVKTRSEK